MTPHTQAILSDPAKGVRGDCYRTAIASVLDMEPTDLPHYCDGRGEADSGYNRWLLGKGWQIVSVPVICGAEAPARHVVEQVAEWSGVPRAAWILVGNARGSDKTGECHAVVVKSDGAIHDPHPSREGLTGPLVSDVDGSACYWATFLVKEDAK